MPSSSIDRKSTRLNSSHLGISYAVFCLKKKNRYDRRPRILLYTRPLAPPGVYGTRAAAGATHPLNRIGKIVISIPFKVYFFFFVVPGPPKIFPFSPPTAFSL